MHLPLARSVKLIEQAQLEKKRETYYQWWLARYPLYTEENYETFDDFYDKLNPEKVEYDNRSKDEIMEELLGK